MKIRILIGLVFFLASCSTVKVEHRRLKLDWTDVAVKTLPTDLEYESIELDEVRNYWFEAKKNFRLYKIHQYDCEDFTRYLITHIMLNHDYEYTPAICDARIWGHSLFGFTNNKGEFIYMDAQSGKVIKDPKILDRIY